MSRPNIGELLKKGHDILNAKHDELEKTKLGTYRGGNSGAKLGNKIYGKCHRITLARTLGYAPDIATDRNIMFAAGVTNEDSWNDVLVAAWDGVVLREEEVPIKWMTTAGTPVTGRPDFVLAERTMTIPNPADPSPFAGDVSVEVVKPVLGLELKLVSSFWTMVSVLIGREPKSDHVIQAAHYSWQLGIPFELWYTSRVDWAISGWTEKFFRGMDKLMSWVWNEPIIASGAKGPKKVFPFYIGYELEWDGDLMYYRQVGTADWFATVVTKESIANYYNFIDEMRTTKTLGPRPESNKITGNAGTYDKCSAEYCPWSKICDKHEDNYDNWVKAIARESKK